MSERPEIPDPQHDRHVAFPDEPASPPPDSWWAPTPPAPAPPPRPMPAPQYRPPQATRRRPSAWGTIVLLVLLGGFMSQGHDGQMGMSGGMGPDGSYVEQAGPSRVALVEEAPAPRDALVPADSPLYAIPQGTLWFRLEVVGGDPRAAVEVATDHGYGMGLSEVALPYAGRLSRDDPGDTLSIDVHGAYGQKQVQCRVYLGNDLVALGTGEGTATCEVPAWR